MNDPTLNAILERFGVSRPGLTGLLHAVQDEYRFLPEEALVEIARRLGTNPAEIVSIASFYPQFRFSSAGRHRVKVCVGTACHVKGAETVYHSIRDHLLIKGDADTDPAGRFTVEKVACLGCCMLAPAVQIDEVTYGYLSPLRVPRMVEDFLARDTAAGRIARRGRARPRGKPAGRISLCTCSSCAAAGADKVWQEIEERLHGLGAPVALSESGCSGVSYEAPLVEVTDPRDGGRTVRYGRLTPDAAANVVEEHFSPTGWGRRLGRTGARFIERVLLNEERPVSEYILDLDRGPDEIFWNRQTRIVTEGALDHAPLDLKAYRAAGGFAALDKARAVADKSAILDVLEESGLRGRGGAGFPAGRKWRNAFEQNRSPKYVVCNGDEGDPGAFMDRMILESHPFRVIEGLLIAAAVLDAAEAFLYVRAEYPLALKRLREAAARCEEAGLSAVGKDGAIVPFTIVEGGGAFVCGEETALLASLEGRRGQPRVRPPFPAENGLHGQPTLINNVETFASVPWIINHGARAFRDAGNGDGAAGTKTFALAGKVRRGGLIEVPLGMTLREIVLELGGGVAEGRVFKAVQIGGPSGGLIPAALANTRVDYDELRALGAMMGSGGLVVLDDTDCMVEMARYFMSFTQAESCGACAPCRIGTRRMQEILTLLTEGRAGEKELAELEDLARTVRDLSRCGLGRTAPNPVLTSLRHFREEYLAHTQGRCPAGLCKALIVYAINEKCLGCTRCAQVCPAEAIAYMPYERHVIDASRCTRCDSCRRVCPADAVEVR